MTSITTVNIPDRQILYAYALFISVIKQPGVFVSDIIVHKAPGFFCFEKEGICV
jgi:hypothetical protein